MRVLFDIETDGLLESVTTVHCIEAVDVDTQQTYSFGPGNIDQGLCLLATADVLIGHNIQSYDIPVLQKLYPDRAILARGAIVRDTLICSRLIWADLRSDDFDRLKKRKIKGRPGNFKCPPANLIGRYSLEAFGHRLGLHKGEYSGGWDKWSQEMQDYCAQDVQVTLKLFKLIESLNYSEQAIEIEHGFAYWINRQEQHGFHFDKQRAESLAAELYGVKADLEAQLQEVFPPKTVTTDFIPKANNKTKGYIKGVPFKKKRVVPFNPSSRHHIAERLKELGWQPKTFTHQGQPEVSDKILASMKHPAAKLLAKYLMVVKRLGQLCDGKQGLLKLEKAGRIHGQVKPNGVPSGRCAHVNPNVAQTPSVKKDKVTKQILFGEAGGWKADFRAIYVAPEGYSLVGADMAGIQLRGLGHYMAKYDGGDYINKIINTDIHEENLKVLTTKFPYLTRDDSKKFIYTFMFGAGAQELSTVVRGSVQQGALLKKTFLAGLPALKKLTDKVEKRFNKNKTLKGLDGRIVPLRSSHSALCYLLQSFEAILMKFATVSFNNEMVRRGYVWGKDWAQVAHIHDEIQVQVRHGLEEEVGQLLLACFKQAGEHFNLRIPIDGEYKIGRNWAETH